MFEGIVASILNMYLSEYIDEVDYNNLKLGLFSGSIELSNIKIKPSAMYQFDLPMDVKCGKIGKLKLNISWRNILTKPAVAVIEDIFVLLGPFEEKINDPKRIEELLLAHKRKQLQEFDKIDKTEITENKEKGYAEKVQDTIINNIQIYVKNVHIRYEDKHSIKNKTISFGIYLKEFKAETVDSSGKPNFLNADEKIIFKIGSLTGFNIYWNFADLEQKKNCLITTHADYKAKNHDFWSNLLKESIDTNKILNESLDNFMETNLDLITRLTLRRSYLKDENQKNANSMPPKITFESSIKSINFVFQRQQYKSILELIDHYSMLNLHKKYVKYRPKEELNMNKSQKARLWWKYAFTAIAETTWRSYRKERMSMHWSNYKLYIKKYDLKIQASLNKIKQLDQKELDYLNLLEKSLLLESIFDIRNMIKEKYKIKSDQQVSEQQQQQQQVQNKEKKDAYDRPLDYVEFRLILNFPLISLKLINSGYTILQLNLKNIISRFETRPVADSIYFLLNTRGIDIYGVHYKQNSLKSGDNKLVSIVKSTNSNLNLTNDYLNESNDQVTLLASEDADDMLFIFCFESNPIKYDNAEFSIRTRVSSVEVFYEKTAITEFLRFFKTDLIDFGEVKKIKQVWSKAGVIYAVENHKQFHVKAELSSPYFIIPVKGTCTEQGNSIVFYLGKTLIQSQVQEKLVNYTPKDIQDLEKNFYDKLSLSVNDVQVLLIPSHIDWKDYLDKCRDYKFKFHLLYPVSTQNTLYLSINPSYRKLPKMKIDAVCSSIRLNFSDNKIIKLYEFAQNFPLPEVPQTSSVTSVNLTQSNQSNQSTSINTTNQNSNQQASIKISKQREENLQNTKTKTYFTLLGGNNEEEPDDEWNGPFNLPLYINGDPIPNYSQIIFKFNIIDFSIDLNASNDIKSKDPIDFDYLKFIFNSIKIDMCIAKYGLFFRAGLGDLKLIDKKHPSKNEEFTEILSSSSRESNQIIKFYFRQVEKEAPNFHTLYSKILSNILFDCSNIHVKCHRTAIVNFILFFKGITDNISITSSNTNKDLTNIDESKDNNSKLIKQQTIQNNNQNIKANTDLNTSDICELNLIARMNELTWNMFDTNLSFGDMIVKELCLNYNLCGIRTDLKVQLRKILINYGDENNCINDFYQQIISCTGDGTSRQFFDFNIVLYNNNNNNSNSILINSNDELIQIEQRDCLKLRVGKIKIICMVKFVNELINFINPIINPLPSLTEQVKEQAYEAVKYAYQETQVEGKKIYFDIHVTSPQVIIPQNSQSFSGFLVDLGNLSVTNEFYHIKQEQSDLFSVFERMNLALQNVEIKRIVYKKDMPNYFDIKEQVIVPISLTAEVRRAVKNLEPNKHSDLDIKLEMNDLECVVSLKSAKLLFAILDENLNEGLDKNDIQITQQTVSNLTHNENRLSKVNEANTKKISNQSNNLNNNNDRINLKIDVELRRIKLIIVEYRKTPVLVSVVNQHQRNRLEKSSSLTKENSLNMSNETSKNSSQNQISSILLANDENNSTANLINNSNVNSNRTKLSHLEIQEVYFKYLKNENSSWLADFKMRNLILNDVRPDSNLAVKEIINSSKHHHFIDILYKVESSNQEQKLNFKLDHLRINLCLPYILKIYGMAMDAISSNKKPSTNPTNNPTTATNNNNNNQSIASKKKQINEENEANETKQSSSSSVMSVIGSINLPDVVLFSEPEKFNSKILKMNAELSLLYESINSSSNLEIDLKELGIRLGEHNNSKREGIQFLSPCSALIQMKQVDSKKPANYKANIDSLYFNMTPTLYEVVMGVINTINRTGTETVQKESEIKKLIEESEPFVKHEIDSSEYDSLKKRDNQVNQRPEDEHQLTTFNNKTIEVENETDDKSRQLAEYLDLTIREAYITFCEETSIDLQPLAIVKLQLNGRVSNWTRNIHTKASLTLEASYYNDLLSNWEPLIENVMQNEDSYRPWILSLWFAIEPGGILQPPIDSKGIETIEFPVKDLDYSIIESENKTTSSNETELTDIQLDLNSIQPMTSEAPLIIENHGQEVKKTEQVLDHVTKVKKKFVLRKSSKKLEKLNSVKQEQIEDEKEVDQEQEQEKEIDQTIKASYILIESNDLLNINVTPSAYKVIMYLAQITSGSNKEFLENRVKPPLKFLNFLGEQCDLIISSNSNLRPEFALDFNLILENRILVSSNLNNSKSTDSHSTLKENIQTKVKNSQRSQIDTVYNENYKFIISLPGFEKCKLSMKNDGCFLFQLREKKRRQQQQGEQQQQQEQGEQNENVIGEENKLLLNDAIKYNVMFKVRTLYGRTKVIFSSPLQIENNCQLNLYIMIEINDQIRSIWNSFKFMNTITIESDGKSYAIIFKLVPSKIFYVPLFYAYNCKIYATPEYKLYSPAQIFDIRGYNLRAEDTSEVTCKRRIELNINQLIDHQTSIDLNDFHLLRHLSLNVRNHRNVMPAMHANYKVALYSPIKIINCLPFQIRFDIDDNLVQLEQNNNTSVLINDNSLYKTDEESLNNAFNSLLEPSESLNIHLSSFKLNACKLHVLHYLNTSWLGVINFEELCETKPDCYKIDMLISPTTEMQVSGKHLNVCISYKKPNEFTFYCPYWLVNKSGQPIKIRGCDGSLRTYNIPDDSILLFDYKRVDKNNKVRMSIKDGRWSNAFSLETAGTTGMIQCKDNHRTYNFLIRITMSNSSRAKLITLAPFLSIANQLDETIWIREWHRYEKTSTQQQQQQNYDWKLIEQINETDKPVALWPNYAGESKQVCFVIKTSNGLESQPFPLENPGRFVLILKQTNFNNQKESTITFDYDKDNLDPNKNNNKEKIVTILISGGSQNPVTIVVRKYQYGDSVAKLVNLCDNLNLNLKTKNSNLSWSLESMKAMVFVWPELIKTTRDLYWTCENSNVYEQLKLTKSGNDKYEFYIERKRLSISNHSNDDIAVNDTRNLLINQNKTVDTTINSTTSLYNNNIQKLANNRPNDSNDDKYVKINCVSYLDGVQRIIVFTTDDSLAEIERKKEASTMEIFVSFKGMQVSIINNVNLEIATISLKDSPSSWELCNPSETKLFNRDYCEWLERQYCQYFLNLHSITKTTRINQNDESNNLTNEKFMIDFKNMKLIRPEEGDLVRKWQPGLSVQYRVSPKLTSLKCCVYKLQIDNQLPDAYFPIVFHKAPVKLVDELANSLVPFMSVSLFTEQQEVTQIYRYFDCILQEFYFKVDKGFIYSIKDWYDAAIINSTKEDKSFDLSDEFNSAETVNFLFSVDKDKQLEENINLDVKLTKEIMEYTNQTGSVKQSAHIRFEEFYLSPIQFNLSFSVNGTAHTDDKVTNQKTSEWILNFFLESIGATITEFKDIKFKFNPFAMSNQTKTWKEIYDELFDHYKIQALHQAYVLILGLDVLGNPFGLVSDFSQGLTDLFYDPLLGVLSGNNSLNRGELKMSSKVKTTVNKTISSAAGSGSLITGSIGRVLATCTFDAKYKKKRQYKISKASTSSFSDSLSSASKGVVSGLVYGLTGLVHKPIEERHNGVKSICLGTGKGLVGLFAKPVGSVFDGISLSLDGLKRFAQSGSEPIVNVRLPRHLIHDVSILPYSEYQAKGYEILRDLQNDDIAQDEFYWAHIFIENKRYTTLLFITDCNIYKLKKTKTQIFAKWKLKEEAIPLHKITQSRLVRFDLNGSNIIGKQRRKLEQYYMSQKNKQIQSVDFYQLYVTFKPKSDNYDFDADTEKNLLVICDYDTCNWINDKINSAIKYYKELKNFFEIV